MTNGEIGLGELWLLVLKRKKLFVTIFLLVFIVGVLLSLLLPREHNYTRVISLSGYYSGGNRITLNSVKSELIKLHDIFLPQSLANYNKKHQKQRVAWSANNFTIKDTPDGVVVLSIAGTKKQQPVVEDIFQQVLKRLQESSSSIFNIQKMGIENQLKEYKQLLLIQSKLDSAYIGNIHSDKDMTRSLIIANQLINIGQRQTKVSLIAKIQGLHNNLLTLHRDRFISILLVSRPIGLSFVYKLAITILLAFFIAGMAVFLPELNNYFGKKSERD